MKYLLTLITILIIAGCGDVSESNTIQMETNKKYNVSKGDRLVKSTSRTIVSIERSLKDDSTNVVLLEGNAQIISAN